MTSIGDFIGQLDRVPWFANLGKPSPRDPAVFRIYHWSTWPGPEDPGSEMQQAFLMKRYDELFGSAHRIPGLRETWKMIEERVIRLAKPCVPFKEDEDVWYGPNMAVFQAAYTTALVGCTILRDGHLEEGTDPRMQWTLAYEWWWYRAGHWPCMYYWPYRFDIEAENRAGYPHLIIVY